MPTLDFKGKQFVYAHHLTVPYRTLDIVRKKSVLPAKNGGADGNKIIQGDNLEALKALMPEYAGRVNCVYIDPPYNTGHEGWCYNDNVNAPVMRQWLEANSEVDKEDMERHDKWCCMMWPRLQLLRDLLAEDGVIFMSIDDNEVHHLRAMMNEIFGEENHIASFVWEGTAMHSAKFVAVTHDYILCYAKNKGALKETKKKWRVNKRGLDAVYKQVAELRGQFGDDYDAMSDALQDWYKSLLKKNPSWQHRHYKHIDKNGCFYLSDISPMGQGGTYDIKHPVTGKTVKRPRRGWLYAQESQMREAISQGLVCFGPDETTVPTIKSYLHDTEVHILNGVIYQDRRGASKNLRKIFGEDVFPYPKDHRVLMRILEAATDENSIVLDSFAGSGTTAHAVLALNKEDGGARKFILVEREDYADSTTAERVRRVIKGVPDARDETLKAGLGGGFAFYKLGAPMDAETLLAGDALPEYETLARYIAHTATGMSLEKIKTGPNWFFAETPNCRLHLIYKPDRAFLASADSALTEALAQKIGNKQKTALVFAPWKFMSQKELTPLNIKFCALPYAIYRLYGAEFGAEDSE